ncbi:MAG: hypothetical protein ACE5LL_08595 [Alphaproteobacteria bacterium]
MPEHLHDSALAYHRCPKPGKPAIHPRRPLANQRDLALAVVGAVLDAEGGAPAALLRRAGS